MKTRISLIAPTFLPSRRANTIQVMKMAEAFVELGKVVQVLVPETGRIEGADGSSRGQPAGFPPDWVGLAEHYGLAQPFDVHWLPAAGWLRGYDFAMRALRRHQQWQGTLVFTRHPQTAALASLQGAPAILELHDLPAGLMGPNLLRLFLRGRGGLRTVVITHALSKGLRDRYRFPASSNFMLITPDAVDLRRYHDLPNPGAARKILSAKEDKPLPLFPDRFTIGYTGHLYPGRGTGMIISLAERLPQYDFLVVGGAPDDFYRFQSEGQARGLKNLFPIGFVPNADLPLYQAACDVLLMPYQSVVSASSGGDIAGVLSPMKLFEYLASGRVILSSDLPVLREVLGRENAVLLPAGDLSAWETAIIELDSNEAKRAQLGAQARLDAENYTWIKRAGMVLKDLD